MAKRIFIRQVLKEELEKISELERSVFEPMNYPLFVLRQFYDLMPDLFLAATTDTDEIVGYTLGGIDIENKQGWILSLLTNPEYQGKGIGYSLSKKLVEIFRKKEMKRVLLTVHPKNKPALELYYKLGFELKELIKDYFGDESPRYVLELK